MPKVLIIADDLTGAADCGVMFRRRGMETVVLLGKPGEGTISAAELRSAEVVAIDADTRCMGAGQAGEIVGQLVRFCDDVIRQLPEIIDNGYLYVAQPPLYRVSTGKQTRYANSEKERDRIVKELNTKNVSVQRFKGLGEMNAEQLWETTMNKETRTLLRAEVEDAIEADAIFTTLMGEKVAPRKEFIKTEARKVQNLDV